MKKNFLFILLATILLVACDKDNEQKPGGPDTVRNENANGYVAWGVTETGRGTNIQQVAKRLEIPRLRGGQSNVFVCHTAAGLGVNYCCEWDCSKLASRWTAYQWYTGFSSRESNWNRNAWNRGETFNGYGGVGDPFQPDPLIPRDYQTTLDDHRSNGHDRGHMLGSADRLNSREANGQTFYLTNMHPQLNAFNAQGIWFGLEERLRKQYDITSFRDTLYVVKGGTIDNNLYYLQRGASGRNLIVPRYFFMALLCKNSSPSQGGYKAIAFWMEHKGNMDTDFRKYAISIDELEEKTDIDFFCNLPDEIENVVESNMILSVWGLK